MKRLDFDEDKNLVEILKAIHDEPAEEIGVFIHPQNPVFEKKLNKEIAKEMATSLNKKITFKDETVVKKPLPSVSGEAANLGFVEGRDIAKEAPQTAPPKTEGTTWKDKLSSFLAKFKRFKKPKWIIAISAFVVLLVIGIVSLFWLLPSASVTLYTQPQFKDAELTLIADSNTSEVNPDEGIIPLKTLDNTQEDEIQSDATGTKTVGTKAKGRVKIVNRDTTSPKSFFKGTIVTPVSGSNISFSLDNNATLSAAPAGCEADCPQKGVDVTARTIGKEGNLPSGTVFKVGSANVNLVFAKNETNFTGGTSNKIKVVSADDHKKAKEALLKKMKTAAKKQIEEENPDTEVPEGGLEEEILDEIYSKGVGEEADSFSLNMRVKFTAKTFSKDDLKDILLQSISESIPFGFQIDREASTVSSEIVGENDSGLEVLGKIKADLVPSINEEEVRKKIAGMGFGEAENYLTSLESVTGYDTQISPRFFKILGVLPFLKSRIEVKIIQKEE